jgi:hypothetical protein
MPVIEPKSKFRALSEDAVMKALEDTDAENPVAVEVARLITGYMGNFQREVKRLGYMPSDILHIKPRWPIEAVAMRLTTETIRDSMENGFRA